MNLNENSKYMFETNFNEKDIYQVKVTEEFFEDLENSKAFNEVILKINEKTGTVTVPQKNNLSKVFNLNIEPISRGTMESLEMNILKPNKTVESIGNLNFRFNIQATSKVYDARKTTNIEDGNKKGFKLTYSNKNSPPPKVFQNKKFREIESNKFSHDQKKINNSTSIPKYNCNDIHQNTKKEPKFSIREKVLHLLALKPFSKDGILLGLRKLGITSADRSEVEKHLNQVATLNKDNMYHLSPQFIFEIRDDWPQFNDENRKRISKLKLDAKLKISDKTNIPSNTKKSNQRDDLICKNVKTRNKVKKESSIVHSSPNSLSDGKSFDKTKRTGNGSEKLLNVTETNSKESGAWKQANTSPKSIPVVRQNTISPADSNISSSKSVISTDEGFASGDKRSPLKLPKVPNSNKRGSQHLSNNSLDNCARKIIHLSDKTSSRSLSRNELYSSSSCDVTPESDVSHSLDICLSNNDGNNTSNNHDPIKINDNGTDETQARFNIAFEEYSRLCSKLKEREVEVERLRNDCKEAKNLDYGRMCKIAKSLLEQMETPQFQETIDRVKSLETEMCGYIQILTGQQLN